MKEKIYEKIGSQVEVGSKEKELEKMNTVPEFSIIHNVTITINRNGNIEARQLNNRVFISDAQKKILKKIFYESNATMLNIPYDKTQLLLQDELTINDIIVDPVNIFLFSSKGLVAGEKMTSLYPSEGIWTIADWLSRHNSVVAPICVDPNMITDQQVENLINEYNDDALSIYAFSVLPVNLENDLHFISKIKNIDSNSIVIAGGIGSEALSLLPTKNSKKGVEHATDIDLVIPGTGVIEMSEIITLIHNKNIVDKKSLIDNFGEINTRIHELFDEDSFATFLEDLRYSRELATTHFIPFERGDIVHNTTYAEFNAINRDENMPNVVSVLTDNRCDQKCFFCSSPKQKVFDNVLDAIHSVREKTSKADIIVFNNNDLSNNPTDIIELCQQMIMSGINQPKHGKLRANRFLPDLYDALVKANFVRLGVGVESFSQEMRIFIGKGNFSNKTIDQNLSYMLEKNIRPEINLILFLPRESDQTLKLTVMEALKWIKKGAWILPVMGLYAVPNSPAVMKILSKDNAKEKIEFKEIYLKNQEDSLLFPDKWKTSEHMTKLHDYTLLKRDELIKYFSTKYDKSLSVPIRSFAVIASLAHYYKITGYVTSQDLYSSMDSYVKENIDIGYIHI